MAVNTTRMNNQNNDEVFFSIVSYIGVLAEYQTGWKKEVNLVAWNGNPPKFDVRDWSPDHERMSRGITLHEEEARRLAQHLSRRFRSGARMVHTNPAMEIQNEQGSVMQNAEPCEAASLDVNESVEATRLVDEAELAGGADIAENATTLVDEDELTEENGGEAENATTLVDEDELEYEECEDQTP